MSDSPQSAALARSAAEAIRGLCHATLGVGGLEQPADAYELLGELSLTASRLPQLLGQVSSWLAAALAGGKLACDDGADPAHAVGGAWLFISDARGSAAALARDLEQAQQQLASVNGRPSQSPGKEARP